MNLVFDLGGVVVRWDPDGIVASVFPEKRIREAARREIFDHPDWLALDRGTLPYDEALGRAVSRTGLPRSEVKRLFDAVPPSLVPIPETVDLLRRLKHAGHALYCLSNMGFAGLAHLERSHDFLGLFEGKVFSCQVNLCKPEPEIFRHLLRTCALEPARSVFIDDVETNVAAARSFGMHAIRFESAAQCERELAAFLAGGADRQVGEP